MRKKIGVDDLAVGMFVAELCGAWLDNPFWCSSFLLSEPKHLLQLQASKIREVWIDTEQGADIAVQDGCSKPAQASQRAPLEAEPESAAVAAKLPSAPSAAIPPGPRPALVPTSIADELERAAKICAQARGAVTSMFREARMGNTVNAETVGELVQEISDSVSRNASALISLARLKTADDYTYMHSVAVCAMMIALAKQLNLGIDKVRAAGVAGLLHDMGKALLPIELLNKPGKLTDAEFAIVRTHPALGHKLLAEGAKVDALALDVCLHHHEKIDGSGYPQGRKADQISIYAKMGAVCDVYDAITSNRPYKTGWDPAESMRQMAQWSGGHFDATVFQAFARSLGIYPVGSLVRLTSGRIGVVVEQSEASLTTPIVKLFFSSKTQQRIDPSILDLSDRSWGEKIVLREDPAKWNFPDINELWSGQAGTTG